MIRDWAAAGYGIAGAGRDAPARVRGMAEMDGFDRQRLFSALILVVTALFVSSGVPQLTRWRRRLRLAAIVGFLIALAAALADIALWWAGRAL
jgi:hypothetical protein